MMGFDRVRQLSFCLAVAAAVALGASTAQATFRWGDIKLSVLPVSFRIGRQQMNWGEADSFRALDSVNPIDLSWHLQQEAGLIGKVGFDELRVPLWAVKMLVDIGQVGPLSNMFLEAYDD